MKDINVYQWDLNRFVATASQTVHFAPVVGDVEEALVVAVQDGKAQIPNKLLQLGVDIYAWGVIDGSTVDSCRIRVTPRAMPSTYEYTETHVETFESLTQEAKEAIQAIKDATIKGATATSLEAGKSRLQASSTESWSLESPRGSKAQGVRQAPQEQRETRVNKARKAPRVRKATRATRENLAHKALKESLGIAQAMSTSTV